jgi:hypothetical protein
MDVSSDCWSIITRTTLPFSPNLVFLVCCSYKHSLFHRDRPENLHLVRRRTCPGLDGRKQRFSRFSARKINQSDSDSKSDDDSSSVEIPKVEDLAEEDVPRKRELIDPELVQSSSNKRCHLLPRKADLPAMEPEPTPIVDASLLERAPPEPAERVKDPDPFSLIDKKQDKVEMVEQSVIVSEVAEKLEQFARKAMKGRSRTRRGASGVVTPPYGGFSNIFSASSGLLTYDDEAHGHDSDDNNYGRGSSMVVTQSAESSITCEESSPIGEANAISPVKIKSPPVGDPRLVDVIARRLLAGSPPHCRAVMAAMIVVASFCMSTAPSGDDALCSKILQLIASCSSLLVDFQNYRAALHPVEQEALPSFPVSPSTPGFRAVTVQQIWERTASRCEAVRDFKIFAVNCINKILGKRDLSFTTMMSPSDRFVLEGTADIWQRSAGLAA